MNMADGSGAERRSIEQVASEERTSRPQRVLAVHRQPEMNCARQISRDGQGAGPDGGGETLKVAVDAARAGSATSPLGVRTEQ